MSPTRDSKKRKAEHQDEPEDDPTIINIDSSEEAKMPGGPSPNENTRCEEIFRLRSMRSEAVMAREQETSFDHNFLSDFRKWHRLSRNERTQENLMKQNLESSTKRLLKTKSNLLAAIEKLDEPIHDDRCDHEVSLIHEQRILWENALVVDHQVWLNNWIVSEIEKGTFKTPEDSNYTFNVEHRVNTNNFYEFRHHLKKHK